MIHVHRFFDNDAFIKQEILAEVSTYERLIYVIRTIANDLIQSGGVEAQQIVNIKSQLDRKWSMLNKKFQSAPIFKGRVTLRVLVEEVKYKDSDDEVSFIITVFCDL